MRAGRWCVLLLGVISPPAVQSQLSNLPPFQQKALLAFSPTGIFPASVELAGTATWTAGSLHENGNLQLQIAADGSTTENWALKTISRRDTQTVSDAGRSCQSVDATGKAQSDSGTSCQQPVPWFAPWYALQVLSSGDIAAKDETGTTDASAKLTKLTYTLAYPALPKLKAKAATQLARFQQATAVTIYYDGQTALPARLDYKLSTDGDDSHALDVSVHFSDYRAEAGFMMPHRIERFVQRTLQLDYVVTSVTAK